MNAFRPRLVISSIHECAFTKQLIDAVANSHFIYQVTIMPMTTITRIFEFDAGHRVWGHEGKCAHLHGHRYKAEVSVSAPELDSIGRVIDFSCLKEIIGGWIDANWDHNMLLNADDPLADLEYSKKIFGNRRPFIFVDPKEKPYDNGTDDVYHDGMNPTAENMACVLWEAIEPLLPAHIKLVHIKLWETPNCFVEYTKLFHTAGY